MPWNSDLQNSRRETFNKPYTAGGYEKTRFRKLLLITVGILAAIVLVVLIFYFSSNSQQSKYTKSATAAARKHTPNARVTGVKVAEGFATAVVSDPTSNGQARAGNTTIFKVSADGSMEQIAAGSSFSVIDLLGLGVPLSAQAKLNGTSMQQVKQTLANQCDYRGGNVPGYSGFDGSFSPNGWQIDPVTQSALEQTLSDTISANNTKAAPGKAVICVNAIPKNSDATTDTKTYVSTFTLQVQFITSDGTITPHTVTYIFGSKNERTYMLDGRAI